MTRRFARIGLSIWADPDFRDLSEAAQRLYFLLLTSGSLDMCGVGDWRENRLVKLSSDSTITGLRKAAWELGQRRFVAIDVDTEEVLVRSFVRHDGVLESPNSTRAMVKDFSTISSHTLMEIVMDEARRGFDQHPEWKGRKVAEELLAMWPEGASNPSEMVPEWFADGFQNGSEMVPSGFDSGSARDASNPSKIDSPSLTLTTTSTHYVRREGELSDGRPSDSAAAATPPKEPRGNRLPEDWTPTDCDANVRVASGQTTEWINYQLDQFRDYWRSVAGAKGRKIDWDATWRNWIRRGAEFDQRKKSSGRGALDIAEAQQRAARWQAEADRMAS